MLGANITEFALSEIDFPGEFKVVIPGISGTLVAIVKQSRRKMLVSHWMPRKGREQEGCFGSGVSSSSQNKGEGCRVI